MTILAIGWPQLLYLALVAISLGATLAKHGDSRPPYNFWHASISLSITLPLLWWGGFFTA